jgi:hypothetical protein
VTETPGSAPGSPEDPAAVPESPATVAENPFGRVDANGDVFVRTSAGERHIGSWQVGQPEQALTFFGRKYDDLVVQIDLLEQIPHGQGQTFLREILLAADHAAYHVGQLVLTRRLLNEWR